ncbi:MAG: T9SS type A sorting domain-containing protein [Flavobacterium sp.]|uniref:T9SS type A sorting domain-containing protein n=1 Tax=Flavobacterium sp. TaxID=239 RepID=UPI002B4A5F9E|nr:T9SS type A sorting domain-containing protein [Flavobacterium sp.]WRH73264.1 MAG: T9SS type A sorting domain-containing protein [Flavobacterium sp.]
MLKKITLFFLWVSASTYGQCFDGFQIGSYHVVSIKSNGTLWGWGESDAGNLGNTNSINSFSFQIGSSTDWLKVSAGAYNTFIIKNNGTLWAMGDGRYGLLGNGSTTTINPTLQQIGTATNWQKISASSDMTIGLKTDGTVWGWGQNDQYEMGNNTCCANQLTPIQIGTANHWVDVETSLGASVFALKNDGTIWGWGLNLAGLLGNSTVMARSIPTQLNADTDWASIHVGAAHILALKTNGTLWSWGGGEYGQTGDNFPSSYYRDTPTQVGTSTWSKVFAGWKVSFGIKPDGTLWAWGLNDVGQLGIGNTTNQFTPVQVGTDTDWVDVVSGGAGNDQFTIATKSDGTVWAWGDNQGGQYGNGTVGNPVYVPTLMTGLCATLSATEFEQENVFTMYPNPAKDVVNLTYNLTVTNATVSIYDVTGRLIQNVALNSVTGSSELNVSSYPAGVYLVLVKQGAVVVSSSKLVVE